MARQGTKRWWIILAIALVVATSVAAVALVRGRDTPSFSRSIYIYDICFTDGQHGWMVGERETDDGSFLTGVVFATTDGGNTWLEQLSTTALAPNAVSFVDDRRGWIVGAPGQEGNTVILATTDGGDTWKRHDTGTKYRLWDVDFVSASNGWAVGDKLPGGSGVIATTDGGATWKRQYFTNGNDYLQSVSFADAKHGWIAGGGLIVGTRDGGATWKVQYSGTEGDAIYTDTQDVTCVDARTAWAVASPTKSASGGILATEDGGATWKLRYQTQEYSDLMTVAFANANAGWVLGLDGIVLHTVDGGHTWQSQDSGTSANLGAATFVSSSRGWIAAHHYRQTETDYVFTGTSILTTDDGGDTWRR